MEHKDCNLSGTATFFFKNQIEYASIPKYYLRDKRLSMKAKGLLTVIYTLPEEWNYNMKGLCKITGQSIKQIRTILKELEEMHYINRERAQEKNGKFVYRYYIFIEPYLFEDEKPYLF